MEELSPLKRYHKNKLVPPHEKDIIKINLYQQVKKLIAVVQLKKSWEELTIEISSNYLRNTQLLIAEWGTLRIAELQSLKIWNIMLQLIVFFVKSLTITS